MSGENLCLCGADKSECDALIDVYTPFLQVIGGRKYRLLFENVARQILLSDGSNVETRLKTLERALSAFSTTRFAENIYMRDTFNSQAVEGDRCYVFDASDDEDVGKGGAMYLWHDGAWQLLYDGDVPLDVNSIVGEDAGLKIVDGRLAVDLDALIDPDGFLKITDAKAGLDIAALLLAIAGNGLREEDGKLSADLETLASALAGALLYDEDGTLNAMPQGWNTEELITESGTWTAKVSGWHEVTVINGGMGAFGFGNVFKDIWPGHGYGPQTKLMYLTEGQEVSVTIGAGGKGVIWDGVTTPLPACGGGVTSFGDFSVSGAKSAMYGSYYTSAYRLIHGKMYSMVRGGGIGGGINSDKGNSGNDAQNYGAGGAGWYDEDVNDGDMYVGDGMQGCVKIRYFDPDKAGGAVPALLAARGAAASHETVNLYDPETGEGSVWGADEAEGKLAQGMVTQEVWLEMCRQKGAEKYAAWLNDPATENERFAMLRTARDGRLAATDYLVAPDYPLDEAGKAQVVAYRQALRDLPAKSGAPWDGGGPLTPWPQKPDVI